MSGLKIPFVEILKSIPGIFGIRLEEEPTYERVEQLGEVEVRRYAPALVAEVSVSGTHEAAVSEGFMILAGYIFGDNAAHEKFHMTAPVVHQADHPKGQRLAMTTPVTQRSTGDGWTITFFLSNTMKFDEAPKPNNDRVHLAMADARLVAALAYRGNNTDDRRHDARAELLEVLDKSPKYRHTKDVAWAQYNAPFVIPFLKKNEAQVEVTQVG